MYKSFSWAIMLCGKNHEMLIFFLLSKVFPKINLLEHVLNSQWLRVHLNMSIFRYDVMTKCWNLNPDFRPPFEKLRKRMDTYLREEVCNNESVNN